MAAKLLHSLADDNIDFQKQIGCMNGIFHRPHIHHNPNPAGISHLNDHLTPASTDKIPLKTIQEKQRISTGSSWASLSRSSSSSSLECNRPILLDPAYFDRLTIPSRDHPPMTLQTSSPHFAPQNRHLRDLVKDSINREIHGPSPKPKNAEDTITNRDSPRLHSQMSNGSHGSGLDTRQRMHDDFKESLRVLAKFQESPLHHNERRQLLRSFSYHARDGSSSLISRDAPRFSYDGKEVNRAAFDLQDVSKSTPSRKNLPRLSLDGNKDGLMRADSKSNLLKSMQQDSGDQFDSKVQNLQQSSNQTRPPSVVAKLMGLDTLPHSVPQIETNSNVSKVYPDKDFTNISRLSAERDQIAAKLSKPSKNSWKEPNSPRWRNTDSSMKPLSRFPIEPAPWKHTDGRSSQKIRSRSMRAPAKAETAFPSVYSEIEKRLKDLEFTQSGKDLRALKQILEAMQSKKLSQSQKDVQGSNFTTHKDIHEEKQLRFKGEAIDRRKPQFEEALPRRNAIVARHSKPPIVIMKPVKPAVSMISLEGVSGVNKLQDIEFVDNRKGLSSGRTAKDLSSKSNAAASANMKNDRTLKVTKTWTKAQQLAKDGYGKTSGSISPRLQQKKLELERRVCPPTPPDSSKTRRQPNKQLGESNSPGGRRRPKHSSTQESGEKLREINVESRNLNYGENENQVQSNASVITPPMVSTIALHEEKSAEFGLVPVEHSSPVSVLDNDIHKEDSPSFQSYKVEIPMDKQNDSTVVHGSCVEVDILGSREYCLTSKVSRNKLQSIENLVKKLRLLNSSHDDGATDYIACLCENSDPDQRYISEILLASGLLLRDLMDFQFHPSGHPINPELFLVLEQTKASKEECRPTETTIKGKLQRKLVFDSVNEILGRKLVAVGPSTKPWLRQLKLTRPALNAQRLLREVCSEIEEVQSRNMKYRSDEEDEKSWKGGVCKELERWADVDDEISGAVLDIERSIFRDLVNEIVMGESAGLKTKAAGGRPKSFCNPP